MPSDPNASTQAQPEERLRVILADDDPLARRVVRDTLQENGIIVAAEASTGREALELALHYRPDVVLMDVVMPDLDGIDAARRLIESAPDVRVVMLSMSQDETLGLLALRIGAAGFLHKDMDLKRLPHALRGVIEGEAAVSRRFTTTLIEHLRRVPEAGEGLRPVRSPLTAREWEVLDLLCRDATTDEIAEELVLSAETIRTHVKHILRKLDVRSRGEAVQRARELRGLPVGDDSIRAA